MCRQKHLLAYDAEIQELLRKQEERVALTFADRHWRKKKHLMSLVASGGAG